MRWRGITGLFGLSLAFACAHSPATPEETLYAYRRALAAGDAATLRELSDAGFRDAWSEARLERWLKKNPRLLDEALDRLNEPNTELRLEASLTPERGSGVRLVREGQAWRVAEGGVLVARFHTPEAALQTFFFAATGHLGLLRKLLPDALAERYASDFTLGKHLYSIRDRVFRARDALGPITDGMAVVDGDQAQVPYGEGKAVELVLQGERWRIVDIE